MMDSAKKVLLINPPVSPQDRYGGIKGAGAFMPPLGIGYIAAVLRREGMGAAIIDAEAARLAPADAVKSAIDAHPVCIGITASTMAIDRAASLASSIKKERPELPIIIGGAHISAAPADTMELYSQFDIGVIGEAELTAVELFQAIGEGRGPEGLTGIVYRHNGGLKFTGRGAMVSDLDSLPYPAWDLYPPLTKYYMPPVFGFKSWPATSIITSRGCPSRCSFCDRSVSGKKVREHSAKYVVGMMKFLKDNYGIKEFMMYDDTFGINPKRLKEFCERLISEKLGVTWSANGRVDFVRPDLLKLMKKAGCWMLAYGIESGSQEALEFLQKGKKVDFNSIRSALRWTKEAGIKTKGYFMMGILCDTRETLAQTTKFIMELDLDILTLNHFTPFPGTLDYQRAPKYGQFNNDWRLLNQHNSVFIPHGLTREEIEKAIRTTTRKFYFRPKVFLPYLKMLNHPQKIKLLAQGLIALLRFVFQRESAT